MNMALILILLGTLQVTSYRSVTSQTDDSPYRTSTGERTSPDGVAVSQDLLCKDCLRLHTRCKCPIGSKLHYGTWVYIEKVGLKRVNDVMNVRHKRRMDVWVRTLVEEKAFHKKFGRVKLKVYRTMEEK